MAIQELSREEVSAVSGGATPLDGILSIVGRLVSSPFGSSLLKGVSTLLEALQRPFSR